MINLRQGKTPCCPLTKNWDFHKKHFIHQLRQVTMTTMAILTSFWHLRQTYSSIAIGGDATFVADMRSKQTFEKHNDQSMILKSLDYDNDGFLDLWDY